MNTSLKFDLCIILLSIVVDRGLSICLGNGMMQFTTYIDTYRNILECNAALNCNAFASFSEFVVSYIQEAYGRCLDFHEIYKQLLNSKFGQRT